MQFHRKTSNSLSSSLIRLLIKAIIILAVIITIYYQIYKRWPEKITNQHHLYFGTFVTGGSNGNLLGMLAAIYQYDPKLKEDGIFLIDIIDEPIPIRGNKENENYLITQIPKLKDRMKSMNINVDEEKWIFLLARNSYKKYLNNEYPKAKKIRWKDYRLHK